jgi:mannose-6-phosphate isomerase-like protein (cupin superfamily)
MINFVKKNWGNEEWLVNNEKYCAKFLNLVKGFQCSVHYHIAKDETFYVLEGTVKLTFVDIKDYIKVVEPILSDGEQEYLVELVRKAKKDIMSGLQTVELTQGQSFRVKPFLAHKFTSLTDTAKILEVSTTHYEEDSYRLTESGPVTE